LETQNLIYSAGTSLLKKAQRGKRGSGYFAGVSILAAKEFGIDCPSKLPVRFISAGGRGTIYLHAMHSVVDWLAFALWTNGKLVRSLSLSPDNGIIEDIGQRLHFEEPFWSGRNPVTQAAARSRS
jgi:hypothetical protein